VLPQPVLVGIEAIGPMQWFLNLLEELKRVAAARKLGIRLWIMLRDQIDYEEFWIVSFHNQS